MRSRSLAVSLAAVLTAPVVVASASWGDAAPQPRSVDAGCPASEVQEDAFRDVPGSNPHEFSVDCVVHWQVATGRTHSTYGPGEGVSRGQMASFLARLVERSGGTLPEATRDWFGDDDTSPHQSNINRLAEAGVVAGAGDGRYAPTEPVTRAQMAAFLARAYDHRAEQAGLPALGEGENYFPDDDTSPLHDQINSVASAGFAAGYDDGTYRPLLNVPRDQMATFLARVLDLLVTGGASDVPPGPRAVTVTGWQPYATVGPVVLHAPGDVVELVGFHESNHDGAQRQEAAAGGPRSVLLPSRNRGTDRQSAADIVVDPTREVRAPVTGTVTRAGSYTLYCDYTDHYLVIEPDARPGWEVKVLHFEGLRVARGQRVEAGVTVVGSNARILPFRSQVDDHTVAPHWPHLHVEVVDPTIPDRPGSGC